MVPSFAVELPRFIFEDFYICFKRLESGVGRTVAFVELSQTIRCIGLGFWQYLMHTGNCCWHMFAKESLKRVPIRQNARNQQECQLNVYRVLTAHQRLSKQQNARQQPIRTVRKHHLPIILCTLAHNALFRAIMGAKYRMPYYNGLE